MEHNRIKLLDLPLDLLRTILGFVADITIIRCRTMQEFGREYWFLFSSYKFFLIFGSSVRSVDLEYPSEADIYCSWEYFDVMHNTNYLQFIFKIIQLNTDPGIKSLKLPFMKGACLGSFLTQLRNISSQLQNLRALNIPGVTGENNDTFEIVSGLHGLEELTVRDATEANLKALTNSSFRLRYFALLDSLNYLSRTRGSIIGDLLRFTMDTAETVVLRLYIAEYSKETINGDHPCKMVLKYIDSIVSEGQVLWNGLEIDLRSNVFIPEDTVHGDVLIPMKRIFNMVSAQRNKRNMKNVSSKLIALKINLQYPSPILEHCMNAINSCISNRKSSLEIITPVLGVRWNTEEAVYNVVGMLLAEEFITFVSEEAKSTDFVNTVTLPDYTDGNEWTHALGIFYYQANSNVKRVVANMTIRTDYEFAQYHHLLLFSIHLFRDAISFETSREFIVKEYCRSEPEMRGRCLSKVEKILITSRPPSGMYPIRERLYEQRLFFRSLLPFIGKMASFCSRLKSIILQPYEFEWETLWREMTLEERTITKSSLSSTYALCTIALDCFRNSYPNIEIRTVYREILLWSMFI